jgi:hypothetical protein
MFLLASILLVAKKSWNMDRHLILHVISFVIGGWEARRKTQDHNWGLLNVSTSPMYDHHKKN